MNKIRNAVISLATAAVLGVATLGTIGAQGPIEDYKALETPQVEITTHTSVVSSGIDSMGSISYSSSIHREFDYDPSLQHLMFGEYDHSYKYGGLFKSDFLLGDDLLTIVTRSVINDLWWSSDYDSHNACVEYSFSALVVAGGYGESSDGTTSRFCPEIITFFSEEGHPWFVSSSLWSENVHRSLINNTMERASAYVDETSWMWAVDGLMQAENDIDIHITIVVTMVERPASPLVESQLPLPPTN